MSNASSSCFRVTLIISVLVGFGVGTAQAAIVPELTGTFGVRFPFAEGFTVSLCSPFGGGSAGVTYPTGAQAIVGLFLSEWSVSHSQTSETSSFPGDSCSTDISGTTDGPITATYDHLTFTGKVTGGTYQGSMNYIIQPKSYTTNESFNAPFRGSWTNGWVSTGTLSGRESNSDGSVTSIFILDITTKTITTATAPEPSTFMMLGAGLLPVIGVIRRRSMSR